MNLVNDHFIFIKEGLGFAKETALVSSSELSLTYHQIRSMEKLKVLIVEDELIIAEALRIMLEGMDFQVAGIFSSGVETLDKFRPGFADMIFMDIQLLGSINGVDTSIELRKISTVPIIFITQLRDEHIRKQAIHDTNAVYYIHKPFDELDISVAVDLALKSIKRDELLTRANDNSYLLQDCIFVKNGHGFKKVMIADILYLEADGSYCDLNLKDTRVTFSENLSFLERKLSFVKELVRVHRSFIINVNCIHRVHENRLWIGEKEIPIGKTYRSLLENMARFI